VKDNAAEDKAFEDDWVLYVQGAERGSDTAMAFKRECRKVWDAGMRRGEDYIREVFNRPYTSDTGAKHG
jgi:hypothetical protein